MYGNNYWIIAFPVLLWFGVGVGGFAIPVIEASFNDAHVSLTVDRLNVWTNAAVSLTLALNVIGTCACPFFFIFRSARRGLMWGGAGSADRVPDLEHRAQVARGRDRRRARAARVRAPARRRDRADVHVRDRDPARDVRLEAQRAVHRLRLRASLSHVSSHAGSPRADGGGACAWQLVPIIGICFNLLIARASWRANAAAHADSGTAVSYPIRFAAARETKSSGGSSTGSGGAGDVVRKEKASRPGSPLEVRVAREVACDRPSEECSRATSRSDLESGHLTWAR